MKKLIPLLAGVFICGVAFNVSAQEVSTTTTSGTVVKHKTHKHHKTKKHHARRHHRASARVSTGAAVVPGTSATMAPAPATTPPGTAATNTPDLGNNAGTQTQTGIGANIHQKSGD